MYFVMKLKFAQISQPSPFLITTGRIIWSGAEVEVRLPGRFKVSPQIAGALKAVPGVVQVEAL